MKWNFEDPNDKLCKELNVKLWEAINKYVVVCGGDVE